MILLASLVVLLQNVAPTPPSPCSQSPNLMCHVFTMTIKGETRMFTNADLGKSPSQIDMNAVCYGKLSKGSLRFFSDGTAPSSLVGILLPALDPSEQVGALEPDNTIVLYDRIMINNFKATQANWGGAELSWECTI